jgi:uncharacterized protein with PQ loop repeat
MAGDFEMPPVDNRILLAFGYGGMISSLIYRIPQWVKLYQQKKGDDISTLMIFIQNLSYICYIVYGTLQADLVYIISSAISLLQGIIMHCMVYYYRQREAKAGITTQINVASVRSNYINNNNCVIDVNENDEPGPRNIHGRLGSFEIS